MTIVAVIHSPRYEIFEMFDDVLMLGKYDKRICNNKHKPHIFKKKKI